MPACTNNARTLRIRRGHDKKFIVRGDNGTIAEAAYTESDVLPLVAQHRGNAHVWVQLHRRQLVRVILGCAGYAVRHSRLWRSSAAATRCTA